MAKKRKAARKRIQHADIVYRFATRLRQLRQQSGMTQQELARKAMVHVTYIRRLEVGRSAPGLDLLEKLSDALSVPVTQLVPAKELNPLPLLRHQAKAKFDTLLKNGDAVGFGLLNALLDRLMEPEKFS